MPGFPSLRNLLKKNPSSDTRNLIEPSADIRYLAMKLRAGQTKKLFQLLDASDNVYWELEEKGRYILVKKDVQPYWDAIFLKSTGTDEDLQDAIDEIGNGELMSLHLPPGQWVCDANLDLSTGKHVSFLGAGKALTIIQYSPASPTTNPLISFPSTLNRVEGLGITVSVNLTSGPLLKFSSQRNCVIDCDIQAQSDNDQDALKFDDDFNEILGCEILARHYCIEFSGQSSRQIIERCILEGTGLANSVGIRHSNVAPQPLKLFTNNNFIKTVDYGIQIANNGETMVNSRINNNSFDSDIGTMNIEHPLANDDYLIHGNVFLKTGGAAFDIPAGVKQRDNIGLADAN
jgi:hypothetical protein